VIVITDREVIGNIKDAEVCRIKSVSIESITKQNMTRQQQKAEQLFLQKIQHHLENNNLYYSYDYDITQSLQRQINVSAGPRWKKVRFVGDFDGSNLYHAESYYCFIRRMIDSFGTVTSAAK
jgi:hypothetical protein